MTTLAQKIDQLIAQQQNFQKSLIKLASNMVTKQDVADLKEELVEKISHLPTKEEYYTTMDKWMKAAQFFPCPIVGIDTDNQIVI